MACYIITSTNTTDVIRQGGVYVFRMAHTINADFFPELYCHAGPCNGHGLCSLQGTSHIFYEICKDVRLPRALFLYNHQCVRFMDINLCIQTSLSLSSRAASNYNHLLSIATSRHSMLPFVLVSSSELRGTNETQKYSAQVKCNAFKVSNLHTC